MLLTIDTDAADLPVAGGSVGDDTFPHVYGPINASAVGAVAEPRFRELTSSSEPGGPTSATTSSAVPQLNVTPAPPWP